MKEFIVPLMKKAGEKAAEVPVNVRSWPVIVNQPKMPESIRNKMNERDKK